MLEASSPTTASDNQQQSHYLLNEWPVKPLQDTLERRGLLPKLPRPLWVGRDQCVLGEDSVPVIHAARPTSRRPPGLPAPSVVKRRQGLSAQCSPVSQSFLGGAPDPRNPRLATRSCEPRCGCCVADPRRCCQGKGWSDTISLGSEAGLRMEMGGAPSNSCAEPGVGGG